MLYRVSILYRLTVQKKLERYSVKKFLSLVILLGLVPTVSAMMSISKTNETDLNQRLLTADLINVQGEYGNTALMWAAMRGGIKVCLALIDEGADLNVQDEYGNTALMLAAKNRHIEVCLALIDKGADLNLQGESGLTALMWVAKRGRIRICRIILSHAIILPKPLNKDCLLTILCMFNRFKVSKDIRYYILGKLPLESLIGLLIPCKECPPLLKNSLVEKIEEYTIEQLIPMVHKARERASGEELKNLLDPEQFSDNFGEELHSTIKKVVDDNRLYLYKPVIQAGEKDVL